MAGPPAVDPPPGTHWVKHSGVTLAPPAGGNELDFSAPTTYVDYGWESEYTCGATYAVPGVVGNERYWFDKWYFASFEIYHDGVLSDEIIAVQPGEPAPFSGSQYLVVFSGQGFVVVDTSTAPGWPPILHVVFTWPQWGIVAGAPAHSPVVPGVGRLGWQGDVWVAEDVSSVPPGPTTEPPIVLTGTARPSPQAPKFQLRWPDRNQPLPAVEPGDIASAEFARWGLDNRRLIIYELMEHWRASDTGRTALTRYEREYTLVEPQGQTDTEARWDETHWDEGVYAP